MFHIAKGACCFWWVGIMHIFEKGDGQVGIDLVYILYVFDSLFNFKIDLVYLCLNVCIQWYVMFVWRSIFVHLKIFKKRERESFKLKGSFVFEVLLIWVKCQAYLELWSMHGKVACNWTISSKIYHFDSHY